VAVRTEERPARVSAVLQISDPHFGTEQPPVVEALLRLYRQLQPALVIISGDITQRARRAQFGAAEGFCRQLAPTPIVAVPGNHDIPLFNVAARAFYPYANFERIFGSDLEPSFANDALLVLCVNTTRPGRHKDGEVAPAQIERVAARLRTATADQLRIVVTHQPVHVVRTQDIENLLHGHETAIRAWSEAGADIIMGGHIHLPYVRPLATNGRRTWAVQAGTAVSHRIRDNVPNSVNVLRHLRGDLVCSVERWDFDSRTTRFHCVQSEQLHLDRPAL
jgi:3',5'-cyclic AMP phosphodiesterase CpdA